MSPRNISISKKVVLAGSLAIMTLAGSASAASAALISPITSTASTSYALPDYSNIPTLTLCGSKVITIRGTEGTSGDDVILGTDGNDVIHGYGGQDTICGGAGEDQIYGGTEKDTIFGGASNDAIFGEDGNDTLLGGLGNDRIVGGAGTDDVSFSDAGSAVTVYLGAKFAVGAGSSDTLDTIENVVGSNFNDVIVGDNGTNSLKGGSGNDKIRGGLGDDYINGGAGVDEVSYSDSGSPVTVNLWSEEAWGAGDDRLLDIESVLGSSFNDTIGGDEGPNLLRGGAGDDTVHGGLGDDTIDGGTGLDRILYWDASGSVVINLQAGSVTGAAGQDTLTSVEQAWGSMHRDEIYGNDGPNVLYGGGGVDSVWGLGGNDILWDENEFDYPYNRQLHGGPGADDFCGQNKDYGDARPIAADLNASEGDTWCANEPLWQAPIY